jgi:hypothetical protein
VIITAVITDPNNTIVYRDTQVVASWTSGNIQEVIMREFTPSKIGVYKYCAITLLATDSDHSDDTLCINVTTSYLQDGMALAVDVPADMQARPQKIAFNPIARFKGAGLLPLEEPKVRFEILRCSDNHLMFRADTIIDVLLVDSIVTVTFPSKQMGYDIRSLPPGCYNAVASIVSNDDANFLNNSVQSEFSIVPNSLVKDVRPDSIYFPQPGSSIPKPDSFAPIAAFKNTGTNTQSNFKVTCSIADPLGMILYRDTSVIPSLASNQIEQVTFKKFHFPSSIIRSGMYQVTAQTLLAGDEYELDDTLRRSVYLGIPMDVAVDEIQSPSYGAYLQVNQSFNLNISTSAVWSEKDSINLAILFRLKMCNDTAIVFTKTEYSILHPYQEPTTTISTTIPNTLPLGCYDAEIINITQEDGDHTNDTLRSMFYLIRKDLTDNITAAALITPLDRPQYTPDSTIGIDVRFVNSGVSDQSTVPTMMRLRSPSGSFLFDTVIADGMWKSGTSRTHHFSKSTLSDYGFYSIDLYSDLAADKLRTDDTLKTKIFFGYKHDLHPTMISMPSDNQQIVQRTLFKPTAAFRWDGGWDTVAWRLRFEIRSCTNNMIYYRADTLLENKNNETTAIEFPSVFGAFRTDSLPPGCYFAEAIARIPTDTRKNNDTMRVMFNIVPIANVVRDESIDLRILGAFPNPFTASFTLSISLDAAGSVSLRIFDELGKNIDVVSPMLLPQGIHSITMNSDKFGTGTYFVEVNYIGSSGRSSRIVIPMMRK